MRTGYQQLGHRKESLAKQHFTREGFNILSGTYLCDESGKYINGTQLRSKLYNCPGINRTPRTNDVTYLCDTLMGIDFFIDCGHYVIGIDATIKTSRFSLEKKLQKASQRLSLIKRHKLGLKVLNNHSHKWHVKPILKVIVYSFNPESYDSTFDPDRMFDLLDETQHTNIFLNQI